MFACRLARDLGLTLEQVYEMSVTEFRTWAAYYSWEANEAKRQSQRSR
jgi:hypothetical protein